MVLLVSRHTLSETTTSISVVCMQRVHDKQTLKTSKSVVYYRRAISLTVKLYLPAGG